MGRRRKKRKIHGSQDASVSKFTWRTTSFENFQILARIFWRAKVLEAFEVERFFKTSWSWREIRIAALSINIIRPKYCSLLSQNKNLHEMHERMDAIWNQLREVRTKFIESLHKISPKKVF